MRVPTWLYLLVGAGLVLGNINVYRAIFAPPVLEVVVLDVGEKGDAILVRGPSGKTILIDAGRDASILRALGAALPMWQRHIDAVIITSSAAGSTRGLPDVQSRYKVSTLIRTAYRGDRFALDNGSYIDVLWPPTTVSPMSPADSVIVLRISYGTTSFLIQNNLPPRIVRYLSTLDSNLSSPSLTISSSTPSGTYTSDGQTVIKTTR